MSKTADYETELRTLQLALIEVQKRAIKEGWKTVTVFEGRDSAGKDGTIARITEHAHRRATQVVALPKPSDRERSQWYFQRYIEHLPTRGEIVLFDRSWYNRAGVEKVMGFATASEVKRFLQQVPVFERMLVDDGILLYKYWLSCDQERQEERLIERLEDPLKRWKLSPIDVAAREKYEDYTKAREVMLKATHKKHAPWTVVDFNDQRIGRLTLVRDLLDRLPDTKVEPQAIRMPKLNHAPYGEKFGVLKPIAPFDTE
jgi:polyphosphate kinase 2